ncbi:MAG: YheU family protein [Steroidobacter sp.]
MTNLYKDETPQEPVAIPHTELSADALRGVIDSFVLREGTDYGDQGRRLGYLSQHLQNL